MRYNTPGLAGILKRWIWACAVALAAVLLLRGFVVQGLVVRSNSMYHALVAGDVVLVNRAATGARVPFLNVKVPGYSEPRRCDVVVFELPGGKGLPFAKRVVGLPGDTLLMREKALYVNGERAHEPYVVRGLDRDVSDLKMSWQRQYLAAGAALSAYGPTRDNWGPLVVPEGGYFVLGDKRDESLDSRYWGFVEAGRIKGRAALIYFSYELKAGGGWRVRWERVGKRVGCSGH